MRWYAAHIIMLVKFRDGNQTEYPIWENIVLFLANDSRQAMEMADQRGRSDEANADHTMKYDGRPVTEEFVGVRKIIECEMDSDVLESGKEISYSRFEVVSESELRLLASGAPVPVHYAE